ncbi:hypothetical protein [Methanococcoides sp. AM1]|uniref:hypothetical protein n=1 Tax=Methanococcoides sp. AM1 TaxID=1201011 RepID=UPI001082B668|nr:hypothetical protein [Methanococcoides sp. AM1]
MVLYEYAYVHKTTTPIHISEAPTGVKYTCPECKEDMYARPKPGKMTPHFLHYNHNEHSAESAIHNNSKLFLLNMLMEAKENNQDICIEYTCPKEKELYRPYTQISYPNYYPERRIKPNFATIEYSLLNEVDDVQVEKQTTATFRPDISLMQDEELQTAIEIFYSSEDTERKTAHYQDNKINVIKIDVKTTEDYELLKTTTTLISPTLTQLSRLYKNGCGIPIVITRNMLEKHQKRIEQQKTWDEEKKQHQKKLEMEALESQYKEQYPQPLIPSHTSTKPLYFSQTPPKTLINATVTLKSTYQNQIQKIATDTLDLISSNHYENYWTIFRIARQMSGDSSYYLRVSVLIPLSITLLSK